MVRRPIQSIFKDIGVVDFQKCQCYFGGISVGVKQIRNNQHFFTNTNTTVTIIVTGLTGIININRSRLFFIPRNFGLFWMPWISWKLIHMQKQIYDH